jgi:hypothetical protein
VYQIIEVTIKKLFIFNKYLYLEILNIKMEDIICNPSLDIQNKRRITWTQHRKPLINQNQNIQDKLGKLFTAYVRDKGVIFSI